MDDVVIQNDELEELLEDREEKKQAAAAYHAVDKKTKQMIEHLEQRPPYRIGRFVIGETKTEPKTVSFETDAGKRITIKLVSD